MRLPRLTPPVPAPREYDVVISQLVGLPTTGSSVREKPTGGSEWQVIVLAEALAARGLRVAIIGPFFAFAVDRGVEYIPAGEVPGRQDTDGNRRPSVKVSTRVLVSERFGSLPPNVEYDRLVVDLHDIPDARLSGVVATLQEHESDHYAVVVHSEFTASLLDGWPNVRVIPCMVPDEFYAPAKVRPARGRERTYIYGSAAMKGLEATLQLWREVKRERVYHFRKAKLVVTSPGYDQINPKWLEGAKDVEVVTGLSPAGMQRQLERSDGIFHVATYAETFGIVFHQAEIAGKPVRVLRLHGNDDALDTTLADARVFTSADAFVADFERQLTVLGPRDFRVSTVLPRWLDVLGLAALNVTAEDGSGRPDAQGGSVLDQNGQHLELAGSSAAEHEPLKLDDEGSTPSPPSQSDTQECAG